MCNIPSDMKWSFSKLQQFDQCPLAFKLQYIDKMPLEQNAYAEYGTHCHSILERWAKGELMSFELADVYTAEYDQAVKHYFPPFPRGLAGNGYCPCKQEKKPDNKCPCKDFKDGHGCDCGQYIEVREDDPEC